MEHHQAHQCCEERRVEPPYRSFEQRLCRTIFHYYISQEIGSPSKYVEMIHQIQTAPPGSVVWIHLNTPGGDINAGIQIINAMLISEAHTIASIEGEVASLGTLIFLAADEFVVHDNCMLMFHNYSGRVFGKGHEQRAALEAATKWTEGLMNRFYIPFLSQDELSRIKNGEDLYFQSDEVRERLERMSTTPAEEDETEQPSPEAPKPRTKRKSPS